MKQFTSFQAGINSFPLSEARIGLFKAGRYTGFDSIIAGPAGAGIPITLGHSSGTLPFVDSDNLIGTSHGVVLTPQGIVLKTPDTFNFNLSSNTNLPIRYDILYLQYDWSEDVMGGASLLGVVEGTVSGVIPALTSPATQVILGIVTVPEDATFANLTYTPARVPLPGGVNIINNFPELDGRYARLAGGNHFTGAQSVQVQNIGLNISSGNLILTDYYQGNTWVVTGDSVSTYQIYGILAHISGTKFAVGTRLTIVFKAIGNSLLYHDTSTPAGPKFDLSLLHPTISPGQALNIRAEQVYEFEQMSTDRWVLTNAASFITSSIQTLTNSVYLLQQSTYKSGGIIDREFGVTLSNLDYEPYVLKINGIVYVQVSVVYDVTVAPPNATPIGVVPVGFRPLWEVQGFAKGETSMNEYILIEYTINHTDGILKVINRTSINDTGPITIQFNTSYPSVGY
jgi:hypothetical protein